MRFETPSPTFLGLGDNAKVGVAATSNTLLGFALWPLEFSILSPKLGSWCRVSNSRFSIVIVLAQHFSVTIPNVQLSLAPFAHHPRFSADGDRTGKLRVNKFSARPFACAEYLFQQSASQIP